MRYGKRFTDITIRQFVDEISDQYYPMAGAVVAVTAAQAAALGEACMQISLDNQVDKLNWQDVTARIERMAHIKDALAEWGERDANTIAEYMALHTTGNGMLNLRRVLCDSPAEVGQLAVEAAIVLQDFRPLVFEQIQDDLEIAISLLTGAVRAALLVLDSNLRIWPEEVLLVDFEPRRARLEQKLDDLSPVSRVRN